MVLSVLVALSFVTIAAAGNGTMCYECTDIPDPGDCGTVTECPVGQQCFVQQYITSGGLALYTSGCESPQRCNMHKREMKSISRRSDIITCTSCCQGEFCNNQGCGSKALKQPQRGPMCYSCKFELGPKECRTVVQCDLHQTCMLTELQQKSPAGQTLYRTTCQTPLLCQRFALIGRKRHKYCHVCCTDDYCNDECKLEPPPPPPPTTAATTTTTTTTPKIGLHVVCDSHQDYHFNAHSHLCFKIHFESEKSYLDANQICKAEGGALATVDGKYKWAALKHAIKRDNTYDHAQGIYIGGRATDHKPFVWEHRNKTVHFAHWAVGQPNGHNGSQCIFVDNNDNLTWAATDCLQKKYFACTIHV